MENDPLDDRPQPHECEDGWVFVREPYAQSVALARCGGDENHRRFAIELEVARQHVYPCKVCRPVVFFRWAGRHYEKDHDPSSCPECIESMGGRAAARRAARTGEMIRGDAVTEQARRDLSE